MKKYICCKEHKSGACDPIMFGKIYYLEYIKDHDYHKILGINSKSGGYAYIEDKFLTEYFVPINQFVFGK
jgi:hypothetical protein